MTILENTKKMDSKTIIRKNVEMVKRPMQLMELNKGLNLRQQRFFNLAILRANEGISEISKADFTEIFNDTTDNFYSATVMNDVRALGSLGLLIGEGKSVTWDSVFIRVKYDDDESVYRFEWSPYMKDRVENVRKNYTYIQQDLKTLANFKNKYSFILYDYFKSNYRQWKWILDKNELMELLRVSNKKTYVDQHSVFFKQCIEVPLKEINKHTEYEIKVKPIKKGRVVTGYEFTRSTKIGVEIGVTENQINTLKEIVDRYGDTALIMREIANLGVYDGEAARDLTNLFFEIQGFKNFIVGAETFTSDSYKEIVGLAIEKDNKFKFIFRSVQAAKESAPTSSVFSKEENTEENTPKSEFYNWLDERE